MLPSLYIPAILEQSKKEYNYKLDITNKIILHKESFQNLDLLFYWSIYIFSRFNSLLYWPNRPQINVANQNNNNNTDFRYEHPFFYYLLFCQCNFFCFGYNKIDKKLRSNALEIDELRIKKTWSLSYVTSIN